MENVSVDIGKTVLVRLANKERTFCIVSHKDIDIATGCISCDSPIGKAIMGQKIGYTGRVQLPNNTDTEICILDIRPK